MIIDTGLPRRAVGDAVSIIAEFTWAALDAITGIDVDARIALARLAATALGGIAAAAFNWVA